MGERTPAETAFLHFLSALCLFAAVHFPSRNRRFPDRCRSADCASTAFRCRCLLLRQKLFLLPCRRLRNNYILCPTGTPTFAAARRQRRDLIIANPVEAKTPTVADAAACFSHGRRFSLLPLHPQAFPLDGFAVLNDTPEACQTREPTDPQGDRCQRS